MPSTIVPKSDGLDSEKGGLEKFKEAIVATETQIFESIESITGKHIYAVPLEHQISNAQAYLHSDTELGEMDVKLDCAEYVDTESWGVVQSLGDDKFTRYQAIVYLSHFRTYIGIEVGASEEDNDLFLSTYLIDVTRPDDPFNIENRVSVAYGTLQTPNNLRLLREQSPQVHGLEQKEHNQKVNDMRAELHLTRFIKNLQANIAQSE